MNSRILIAAAACLLSCAAFTFAQTTNGALPQTGATPNPVGSGRANPAQPLTGPNTGIPPTLPGNAVPQTGVLPNLGGRNQGTPGSPIGTTPVPVNPGANPGAPNIGIGPIITPPPVPPGAVAPGAVPPRP